MKIPGTRAILSTLMIFSALSIAQAAEQPAAPAPAPAATTAPAPATPASAAPIITTPPSPLPASRGSAPSAIVFFPDWSAALDPSALSIIKDAAAKITASTAAKITVSGYADVNGSHAANHYLTQLRAQRVIDLLIADGVPKSRLRMQANGKQQSPGVASRRVEIIIPTQ